MKNIEIIQVNISGTDKPGLTSALTDILAKYDAFILDIGQANIHKTLALGILFSTTPDKSGFIMKELLFKASELDVAIRFTPVDEEAYEAWVARQGRNRHIITLLGRSVTARNIADITGIVFRHDRPDRNLDRSAGGVRPPGFELRPLGRFCATGLTRRRNRRSSAGSSVRVS